MPQVRQNTELLLAAGLVGGLAYVLYQVIQGVKEVGSAAGKAAVSVAQTATKPIAVPIGYAAAAIWKAINWATSGNVVPSGNVILPNGVKVPTSSLNIRWNDAYNVATFPYNQAAFVMVPNPDPNGVNYDANGDYHAVAWNDYIASLGS